MIEIALAGQPIHGGFFPAVVKALQEVMQFKISWMQPADGNWGIVDEDGNWNGLIADLVHRRADFSACGLTVTTDRQAAADFNLGIIEDTMTLVIAVPKGETMNFSVYIHVFTDMVWLLMFIVVALLATGMVAISTLGPEQYHRARDSEGFYLWHAVSSVLLSMIQRDYIMTRRKKASKAIFVSTSVYAYLLFTYYNGVLTAHMTTSAPPVQISSFQDILDKDMNVYVWGTSSGEEIFASSPKGSPMQQAYKQMASRVKSNKYIYSDQAAVQKVMEDQTKAFFGSTSGLLSYPEVIVLKIEESSTTHLSIALQKNSELTKLFDYHLGKMLQSGLIRKMRNKWLLKDRVSGTVNGNLGEAANPLGYDNLLFPFLGLVGGVILSGVIILAEYVNSCVKRRTTRT